MTTQNLTASPVGRLLNFYLFDKRTTDHKGRPKPEDKHRFEAWVAFRKDDPAFNPYWGQAQAAAQAGFPQGEYNTPAFSWKYKDGDGMTALGKPYPEHCRGCWLVSFTTNFAPPVFNAQNQQISKENKAVKAGDYVQVYGSFKGNGETDKPGIFANLQMLRVCGFGDAIVTGPSADQAFGAAPTALPPGASHTPVVPPGAAPGMVPQTAVAPPQTAVAPPQTAVAPPQTAVAPGMVPPQTAAPGMVPQTAVAPPQTAAPGMVPQTTAPPPYTGYVVPGVTPPIDDNIPF